MAGPVELPGRLDAAGWGVREIDGAAARLAEVAGAGPGGAEALEALQDLVDACAPGQAPAPGEDPPGEDLPGEVLTGAIGGAPPVA